MRLLTVKLLCFSLKEILRASCIILRGSYSWLQEKAHKADAKKDLAKFRWLDLYLGKLYLDEINRDVVDSIKAAKAQESSTTTANRYLALIRAVLRMARDEWEWVSHIPAVKLYKEPRKRILWLKPDEAQRLLNELPRHLA